MPVTVKKRMANRRADVAQARRSRIIADRKEQGRASLEEGKAKRVADLKSAISASSKRKALAGKGMKYNAGGKVGNPFAMTKKEEDKSTVAVLKSDKKFVKNAKREEKKTQRVINRKGRGAEGLAKLQKQLRAKAKRKRKKENRQQKRSNKRAARQLGRQMMAKRVGKALGRGNSTSAKEAGCQGAGCGAYE